MIIVKPQSQTLCPQIPQAQPQPSQTQFKGPISSKGTGADTKILWATTIQPAVPLYSRLCHPPITFRHEGGVPKKYKNVRKFRIVHLYLPAPKIACGQHSDTNTRTREHCSETAKGFLGDRNGLLVEFSPILTTGPFLQLKRQQSQNFQLSAYLLPFFTDYFGLSLFFLRVFLLKYMKKGIFLSKKHEKMEFSWALRANMMLIFLIFSKIRFS